MPEPPENGLFPGIRYGKTTLPEPSENELFPGVKYGKPLQPGGLKKYCRETIFILYFRLDRGIMRLKKGLFIHVEDLRVAVLYSGVFVGTRRCVMMKGIKLWAGILGIVIAAYILLISCYEAAWNVLTTSGHFNGIIGIVIAGLLLAGSIVRIGMRSVEDDSGSIISLVLFAVAAAIAFASTPIYHYMQGWAIVCLSMGIISIIMIMWKNSKMKE